MEAELTAKIPTRDLFELKERYPDFLEGSILFSNEDSSEEHFFLPESDKIMDVNFIEKLAIANNNKNMLIIAQNLKLCLKYNFNVKFFLKKLKKKNCLVSPSIVEAIEGQQMRP
jgi:hypothetical protein